MSQKSLKLMLTGVGILLIVATLAVRLWAGSSLTELPRPSVIQTGPNGRVFLILGDTLRIETGNGESEKVIPLSRFGISHFSGGFTVLAGGDVVMRGDDGYLIRCSTDTDACRPLNGGADGDGFRPTGSFKLVANKDARRLYVADTDGQRLLIVDRNGRILAHHAGVAFPNQIQLVDAHTLRVADTNRHRILTLDVTDNEFRSGTQSLPVSAWPGVPDGAFPVGFAQDKHGASWVVVADGSLKNGALYRVAPDGRPARLDLPAEADVMFLTAMSKRVLAPDRSLYQIHAFSLDGVALPDFGSAALKARLDKLGERDQFYRALFDSSLVALVVIAALLIVALVIQQKTSGAGSRGYAQPWPTAPARATANIGGQPEYVFRRRWVAASRKTTGLLAVLAVLPILLVILVIAQIARATDKPVWGGVAHEFANDPQTYVMLCIAIAFAAFYRLSAKYERLRLTHSGIRYETFLAGPLGVFAPLHPSWEIRWRNMTAMRLTLPSRTRLARGPQYWRYVVTYRDGRTRRINPLGWRPINTVDNIELSLADVVRRRPERIADAIAQSRLFQLLDRARRAHLPQTDTDAA